MRPILPATVALLIPALFCTGCGAIDVSAKTEGTGIQIIGAIRVLMQYKASQNQVVIAEARARRAYVEVAMKPAFEERAKKLRKTAASRPMSPRKPSGGVAADRTPEPPDPSAQARAELAALAASFRSAATSVTQGRYAGDFSVPGVDAADTAAVGFTKLSESQVMAASASYVPPLIAVSVPAEQSVPGSKAAVMLWDTRADRLASDTVYALDRTPTAGKPAEIDNQKALFAAP